MNFLAVEASGANSRVNGYPPLNPKREVTRMEPTRSLSPQQKNSLESTYSCFRGVRAFLESVEPHFQPDEKLMSQNLRELAKLCEEKLVAAFPDLLEWLYQWERGGVS